MGAPLALSMASQPPLRLPRELDSVTGGVPPEEPHPSLFFRSGDQPPTADVVRLIREHRERWGGEPICGVLNFAPATYYAVQTRPPSARELRDRRVKLEIQRVREAKFRVHGADKIWVQLRREGHRAARCTVERLMRDLGCMAWYEAGLRGPRWPTTGPSARSI